MAIWQTQTRRKPVNYRLPRKRKLTKRQKTVKRVKAVEEKPIKYTVTAKKQADGTFEFCGGRGGFNITKQKNKALEPYGKCIHNYGVLFRADSGR